MVHAPDVVQVVERQMLALHDDEQQSVLRVQLAPVAPHARHTLDTHARPVQQGVSDEHEEPVFTHARQSPDTHARPAQHAVVALHVWPLAAQVMPGGSHTPRRHRSPVQQSVLTAQVSERLRHAGGAEHVLARHMRPAQQSALAVHEAPAPPHIRPLSGGGTGISTGGVN